MQTRIFSLLILTVSISAFACYGQEEAKKPFAVAPIISSNPSMGTGIGVTGSYLYNVGEDNPRSQLLGLAQYTDTDSYTIGARNMMHYDGGDQRAMSAAWLLHINNDFDGAEFVSESYGAFHRQSWKVATDWFLGVHGIAMWNNYSPDNPAGQQFLDITGASDNAVYGVGLYATYDTRDNFFYPMQGTLFEASTFSYLDALGSDEDYDLLELKYSKYITVREKDVIAIGYYGRYVSDEVPYSGESYLGRRSALRGFNAGEISGQRLSAIQAEYRYHFSHKWKFVGFVGIANIDGGTAKENDQDGFYYSAGIGARYAIQPDDKVHLRIDIAAGNDDNQGFYIGLQEAF